MKDRSIKQSTLNFVLGGLSIALSVALVVLSVQVMGAFTKTRIAEDRRAEFRELGFAILSASDYLTDEMRFYVQFGDKVHYDNYWKEVNETKTRDKAVQKLEEMGATAQELDLIEQAKNSSDTLIQLEQRAMHAVQAGNLDEARRLVFGAEYDNGKKIISEPLNKFQELINTRAANELADATRKTNGFIVVMIVLVALMTLFSMISLVLSHTKIVRPIIKLKDHMQKVAEGDLSQPVGVKADNSEIGQLAHSTATALHIIRDIIHEISYVLTQMSNGNLVVDVNGNYPGDFAEIKVSLRNIVASFNQVLGSVRDASEQVAASSR